MLPTISRTSWLPEIWDDFFGNSWFDRDMSMDNRTSVPAVNVIENKDEYKIEVAAPGLEKKDFKVDVHKNVLTISSESKDEKEDQNEKYMRREFRYSSFKRSFTLPETVDSEKIRATHRDGILNISVPKKPEAVEKGPKQISIS